MGWRDFFVGVKESGASRSIIGVSPADAVFTQRDYKSFVKDGFQTNPYVYAAVRLRGLLFGSVELEIKETDSQGNSRIINDHPLLDLLNRPNPTRGGADFRSDHLIYKDLAGNGYIEKAGFLERPDELYNLRPDLVQIMVGDSQQPVRAYKYGTSGHEVMFEPERILHRLYLDPINNWYGQSPLEAASQSIDLSNQGRSWNLSLFQNQAKPAGVLESEASINDKSYNRLQKMINKRLSGGSNAGRPLILEGGLKWSQMGLDPTEMDWLEGQKLAAVEAIVPLQVPPELIGISEAKTYGTFKEALRAVWVNGVLPELDSFMSDLNNWLTPGYGDNIKLCYRKNDIDVLAEDQKMIFDQNVQATWRTINEQRQADGKEPIDSGDVVLVPSTMVPLGTPVQQTSSKQVKALNLVHDDEKVTYWKNIDEAREDAMPGAERYALSILDDEANRVADAVKASTTIEGALIAGTNAVSDSTEQWREFFGDVYFEVGEKFARNVFDRVEKQSPIEIQRKGVFGDWKSYVRDYLARVGAEKIAYITATSRKDVQVILLQGIDENMAIPEIAALIRDTLDDGNKVRGTRIARTEVIAASNAGSQAGAASTGLNLTKTWLSTQDGRTRTGTEGGNFNHRAIVDGMKGIAMDQPYTVSNQKLMFPGDTSLGASAGNIVNCRCSEIYDTVTVDGIERIDT